MVEQAPQDVRAVLRSDVLVDLKRVQAGRDVPAPVTHAKVQLLGELRVRGVNRITCRLVWLEHLGELRAWYHHLADRSAA